MANVAGARAFLHLLGMPWRIIHLRGGSAQVTRRFLMGHIQFRTPDYIILEFKMPRMQSLRAHSRKQAAFGLNPVPVAAICLQRTFCHLQTVLTANIPRGILPIFPPRVLMFFLQMGRCNLFKVSPRLIWWHRATFRHKKPVRPMMRMISSSTIWRMRINGLNDHRWLNGNG